MSKVSQIAVTASVSLARIRVPPLDALEARLPRGASADAATRDATRDATLDATDATINFLQGCAARWWSMCQGGNMWGQWDCFLSAARDILGLRLPGHEKYAAWEACAIHGGFRMVHEKFCIVSDFPVHIKTDENNLPHCENGPSHLWRDGWGFYSWHGVQIPGEWIENGIDAATAIQWKNMEQRRAACEIVGWHNILDQLNARTINKDADESIGELLEVDLPDIGRERFLKVKCGTGRTFALPVPPNMTTALEANAWTYGLAANDYAPEIRT